LFSGFRNAVQRRATPLLRLAGVDRAIFFTLVSRGWSALAGPVTMVMVVKFLSPAEQGFFYTFSSLLALQVFFELGLAFVLMQCASHEKAHLEWTDAGTLEGDANAKARLASLLRFALRWYGFVAVLIICLLIPAGLIFFGRNEPAGAAIHWRVPWISVVCVTGAGILLTPFYGILEGCGKISEYARVGARQAIVGSFCFWAVLFCQGRLFAAPVINFVGFVIGATWLLAKYLPFFRDLLATPIPEGGGVRWREDILPFQWKIALSWLSGYFIFHLANPVMFRYHGAVEAGRIGMSLRLVDTLTNLAFSWVSTKAAPFGTYIARRDFSTLDHVFKRAAWQACSVLVLGSGALLGGYLVLYYLQSDLLDRFVDPVSLALLLGNALVSCIIFCQAIYLRAHKQEPFLLNSLAGAVLVPAVMFMLARPYGSRGIAIGLFTVGLLIGLPWATAVFLKKKKEWHVPEI
jgi:hypothetical protein